MTLSIEYRPSFDNDYPFICDNCGETFCLRNYTHESQLDSDEFDAVCYANGIDPQNPPLSTCEECDLRIN